MSILTVQNLSHGFGDRAIFNNVSFRLLKGEHVGFVGANGEGKSTFMSIITGSLQPDEGKIEWSKNVHVGYLDQHTVLEKGMTIRDVLKSAYGELFALEEKMNSICDKMCDASEEEMTAMMEELGEIQDTLTAHDFYVLDSKIDEIGRAFDLDELGFDKDVTELSGGQRTKVLLAKLLLEKPDILLLDEPTNGLDPNQIIEIRHLIKEIATEHSVMLSTHILSEVQATCDDIEMIEHGKVVFSGTMEDFNNYMEPNTFIVVMETPPSLEVLAQIPGITHVEHITNTRYRMQFSSSQDITKTMIELSVTNNWRLHEIILERDSLDSVFAQLSGKKHS